MKRYLRKLALWIFIVTIVCNVESCKKIDWDSENHPGLTIASAKQSFENEILKCGGGADDLLSVSSMIADDAADRYVATFDLNPGEYTPEWDKATLNSNSEFDVVNVSLIVQYEYAGVRFDVKNSSTQTAVWVSQKLISICHHNAPSIIDNFILSIIPAESYCQQLSDMNEAFQYGKNINHFSGVVLYHSLDGELQNAEKYIDGQIVNSLNNPKPDNYSQFVKQINAITGDMCFVKYPARTTYTKISPDIFPQPGTGSTLSSSQVNMIVRLGRLGMLNGNGYANISGAYNPDRSGGAVNKYIPVNAGGHSIIINSISVGYNASNPSLLYNFKDYEKQNRRVVEYGSGNVVDATTFIYHNETNTATTDLRITVTDSQLDTYKKIMNYK